MAAETKHRCQICGAELDTFDELLNHADTVHALSGNKLVCPVCGAAFKFESELKTHQKTHQKR
jgi:rubrerythrin